MSRFLQACLLFLVNLRTRVLPAAGLRCPSVVIAPHQDDEVLGCGGTIGRLRAEGTSVDIVFLTDGSGSHKEYCSAEEMAALRQREAVSAARVLGVQPERVHFLPFASQKLSAQSEAAAASLAVLLKKLAVNQYFIPYHFEPHPDHAAASLICRRAITSLGGESQLLEYPVWFWDHYPWMRQAVYSPKYPGGRLKHSLRSLVRLFGDFDCRVDVGGVASVKQQALAEHVSQVKGLRDDVAWPVLDDVSGGDFSACFARPTELFATSRISHNSQRKS